MIGDGRERPSGPWGSFPLSELSVLAALVLGGFAFAEWGTPRGITLAAVATALGCLSGFELAVREHFARYRSHCLLIAGLAAAGSAVLAGVVAGGLAIPALVFACVFALSAYRLRNSFLTGP